MRLLRSLLAWVVILRARHAAQEFIKRDRIERTAWWWHQ